MYRLGEENLLMLADIECFIFQSKILKNVCDRNIIIE